jgi:hypothetical protein
MKVTRLLIALGTATCVPASIGFWPTAPIMPTQAAEIAQGGLPQGSRVERALRRGPTGEVEAVDPTKEIGPGNGRCELGTICVGPGQAYRTLSDAVDAAQPGMTIEIAPGSYHESVSIRVPDITIRGISGPPHFDCAGLRLTGDKACILLAADRITLENLDITGAAVSTSAGANGACVRNETNLSFTLRRISCHGSQNGLLTDGGQIVIENSEFYDNGWSGHTHNVYFSGSCIAVTVHGSTFRDARIGHEFKSRCPKTEISNSTFRNTKGSRALDIPDGGETILYGSVIIKTIGTQNNEIIGFAAESCAHPGHMLIKGVMIENSREDAVIHNFDKCTGQPIVLDGVKVEGMPVRQMGYILRRN